jgi:hypothetical protein
VSPGEAIQERTTKRLSHQGLNYKNIRFISSWPPTSYRILTGDCLINSEVRQTGPLSLRARPAESVHGAKIGFSNAFIPCITRILTFSKNLFARIAERWKGYADHLRPMYAYANMGTRQARSEKKLAGR